MSQFYDLASLVVIPSGNKASTIYAQKPLTTDGQLSFTRASGATRVGANGLIEEVRTNIALQSQAFNTTWSAVSVTVSANTTANPLDGVVNADTITLSAGSTQKYVTQAITMIGNFTVSCYIKSGTQQFIQFLLGTDTVPFANFDLVNGTANGTNSTARIVAVGNGWYRCSMSFTATTANAVFITGVDSLAAARFASTTSTGTFIAFGYQAETGDLPTNYIPTTTAAVSVGPVSNVPRLDYLGSSCPRLLLEPQRTNLLTFSEQFDNAAWTKTRSTITANNAVSPDGYASADRITDTTFTANSSFIERTIGSTINTAYTYSCFVKAGTAPHVYIGIFDSINYTAIFNLSTGVNTFTTSGATSSITPYANGWYRISITRTVGTVTIYPYIGVCQLSNSITYNGTGAYTAQIWGAQFEAGAYATSYIPTLSASVTRVADAASKTGISSLIGQTEGTLFVESELSHSSSSNQYLIQVSASSADRIFIYREANTNKLGCFVRIGSTTIYTQLTAGAITGTVKAAFAYKSGSLAFYVNGTQVALGTSTFSTPPSMGIFDIDSNSGLENGYFNYNQALLFKTRLTNAQLAELTTL